MVVVVDGLHDDAVAAIADELFDGSDLEALLDGAGLEVAATLATGGGEAEGEEELEWLSNKDAFPTVETMMPAPPVVVEHWTKVARRGRPSQSPNAAAAAAEGLQCRYCGTTKTPQWREGLEGRRTLCNACGVRYRSGRLVPEYRPLNSPTFSPELIHRCVLELRHRPKSPSVVPAPTAAAEPEPEQQRRRRETRQETPPEHERRPPDIETSSPEPHSNKNRRVVELLRHQGPSASANLALAVAAAAAAAATVAGRQRQHRGTKETPPEHEHRPTNIPTTSPEPHSNKHRRVVELPRQGPSASANLALAVAATAVGRECAHCGTTKTPAWRRGPDSRRKLCNTCGNKYRSGKLVPEYRPLNSPTFSPEALLDDAVAAKGVNEAASAAEEEELERLPNKDAFLTVETMAPVAVAENQTTKVAWRGRPAGGQCRHCGTTKTPQWREGPEGRRTLCNACGVRYRSGLLLPEYRPLNSPTFSPEQHSNIHRRVLELRHRPEHPSAVPGPTAAEHVRKETPPEHRPPDISTTSPETHSNKHRSVVELLQQTGAILLGRRLAH